MRTLTLAVAAIACTTIACNSRTPTGLVGGGSDRVAAVAVTPASLTLPVGGTITLTALPNDSIGSPVTSATIEWASSDTTVAVVSANGGVTARRAGTAEIAARAGAVRGTSMISVSEVRVASVVVALAASTLLIDESTLATTEVKDADGQLLTGRRVEWASSDTGIAKVSNWGLVTAVGPGDARITAVSEGVSASGSIAVEAPADTGVASVDTVVVRPGESIQAKVDAAQPGTVFLIKAGKHVRQSVRPKDRQAFVGEPGAILSGERAAIRAFSGSADHVVIKGLVIEHYAPGSQKDAVYGATGIGWLIEGNEFRYNDGGGLHVGKGMRVIRNVFHHNAQTGLGGNGDSVLVEGNEIAFNNYQKTYDYNWEAGGAKFVRTRWLTLRNNYVHDNWGPGLWVDIDCWKTVIEHNRVETNAAVGIFVEISYEAIVRNNSATGNGFDQSWVDGGGIEVNSSPDVEVYGNTVVGNRNGIVAMEGSRGTGAYGPRLVQNFYAHDNIVDVSKGGVSGLAVYGTGTSTDIFLTGRNNRFARNTYRLGSNVRPFHWKDGKISDLEWRNLGMDASGTFTR
jgi:parallel beta-helix repeat protein